MPENRAEMPSLKGRVVILGFEQLRAGYSRRNVNIVKKYEEVGNQSM